MVPAVGTSDVGAEASPGSVPTLGLGSLGFGGRIWVDSRGPRGSAKAEPSCETMEQTAEPALPVDLSS